MKLWRRFLTEEDALGTVELILIIVEIYINYLYVFNVYIRE